MSLTNLNFTVPGTPRTAGSKKAFRHKWTGKIIVKDSCEKGMTWRQDIQLYARKAMAGHQLMSGALEVSFWFILPRPKNHFNSKGQLKSSAPIYPIVKPDALKMARAAEDALTDICWTDDAIIVTEHLHKRYVNDGVAGCAIEIKLLEE